MSRINRKQDRNDNDRERRPARGLKKVECRYRPSEFGDIPMIPSVQTYSDGSKAAVWKFDPDFKPRLPKGAVAGDVTKQTFCPMCHTPRYWYMDQKKTCVQCGKKFIFLAMEQKYWYESLKFHFDSVAIRCERCRHQRRTAVSAQRQVAAATKRLEEAPGDPARLIEFAQAFVQQRRILGRGKLDRAIAAAREAHRISPELPESLFWEAACHLSEGRAVRACALLEKFVFQASGQKRLSSLRAEALEILAERRPTSTGVESPVERG